VTAVEDRFICGVKAQHPLPGNGEPPLENVRAELALRDYSLGAYAVDPDVNVTMPEEIAPGHVLRWSTLEALVADAEVSPTDPAELVPWLRALPVGSVLLDNDGDAWQVMRVTIHPHRADPYDRVVLSCAAVSWQWSTDLLDRDDEQCAEMSHQAPFRVLHTPDGGR
jgi:hypothetical protein